MSTLTSYASSALRDASAPAASNTGLCIFRSDTNAIEVSDGTNYLTYNSDGVGVSYPSNSYSASFDGTNDYIDTGDKFDFIQQTCNFSITFWMKFADYTTDANQYFIANEKFILWYDNRTSQGSPRKLRVKVQPTATFDSSNNVIGDNNWHHIAATCSAGGSIKMYLDGSVIINATAPSTNSSSSNTNLSIGSLSSNPTAVPFGGNLDEVAIFNRELTSSEIDKIRSSPYSYVGATSIYRFENNANDSVGTNNGTNNGATFVTSEKPY